MRRDAILWSGFSAGKKTLAARATLRPGAAASLLPLRVSLARDGDTLVVRGDNVAIARAPVLVGPLSLSEATKALRQTRRYLPLGAAAPDLYATVHQTPLSDRSASSRRSTSEDQVGSERFHYVLGDGRPLEFERRVAHAPKDAKVRLVVTPGPPERRSCRRNREAWQRRPVARRSPRARLTVARELQFQNFLANPNPTGRSTAAYIYETAKRRPRRRNPTFTPSDESGSSWPTVSRPWRSASFFAPARSSCSGRTRRCGRGDSNLQEPKLTRT